MEKRKPSYTVGGNANWYSHYGEQYGDSFKKLGVKLPYNTPVILPGKSRGQRNLVGYSPWGSRNVRHDLATKTTTKKYQIIKMQKLKNLVTFIVQEKLEAIYNSYTVNNRTSY